VKLWNARNYTRLGARRPAGPKDKLRVKGGEIAEQSAQALLSYIGDLD
jgi:hypothetical protein